MWICKIHNIVSGSKLFDAPETDLLCETRSLQINRLRSNFTSTSRIPLDSSLVTLNRTSGMNNDSIIQIARRTLQLPWFFSKAQRQNGALAVTSELSHAHVRPHEVRAHLHACCDDVSHSVELRYCTIYLREWTREDENRTNYADTHEYKKYYCTNMLCIYHIVNVSINGHFYKNAITFNVPKEQNKKSDNIWMFICNKDRITNRCTD